MIMICFDKKNEENSHIKEPIVYYISHKLLHLKMLHIFVFV